MKNGNRRFLPEGVMHVYQRAIHGYNIFYTIHDRLVFYTIFSVFLKRFNVSALALCLMIDHFHMLLICSTKSQLSKFISSVTSLYSRLFNGRVGRKGQLFDKSFGSAPKYSSKQVRTAVPYVFNNPVEKCLCADPAEYRWNFLAYYSSEFPFSEKLLLSSSSMNLRKAIKEIDYYFANDFWLNYTLLGRLYAPLSSLEQSQLTDYVIQKYNPFDKTELISYYKSLEMMNLAIRSVTGSEYSIKEDYNQYSDTLYDDIERYVVEDLKLIPTSLLILPIEEKVEIAHKMKFNTMASTLQIAKYLHIPMDRRGG